MLFVGGQRVAFPPPTKGLKMPRPNRKVEANGASYLASPGGLFTNAMGLAMTYTPRVQACWRKLDQIVFTDFVFSEN